MSKQMLKLIPEIDEGSPVSAQVDTQVSSGASQFNKREFAESLSSVTGDDVIKKMRSERLEIQSQLTQLSQRYKPEHPSIRQLKDRMVYVENELKERTDKIVNNVRANLAGDIKITNVRVIEEALPPLKPSKPNRQKGVLMHTIMGLLFAIAFVVFVERVNQKVRSEKDLLPVIRLPFLGYVPYAKNFVKAKKGAQKVPGMRYAKINEEVSYVENLRENTVLSDAVASVRTHILFSMPYEKSRKIMFTSAIPNEGKSTVACLLALSLTTLGRKILLVDADMRKPYAHAYLGIPNGKGLSDILIGNVTPSQAVQSVAGSTLKVITAGTNSPNPAELLASEALKNLLDELLNEYDRIVIDAPPSLYIPDGLIIAKHVHSGVLVCGAGMVTKKIISTVIQKFDAIGHAFIGIVINRADLEKEQHRYSYYGTYKNYYADLPKPKETK
jgi:capsular exopolysaccharide synthesis family protein